MSDQALFSQPASGRYRILLIDSEEPTANWVKEILVATGARVDLDDLGEYAVERALAGDYDMVIAATNLPDISCQEVVRRLRGAGWRAPIVILTTNPDPDWEPQFYALGADALILWPYNKRLTLGRIFVHLRRWAVLGARPAERVKDNTLARAIRNRDWRPGADLDEAGRSEI